MLGSAVCGQISAEVLSQAANLISSRTFRSFESYIIVSLVYLLLAIALWLRFTKLRSAGMAVAWYVQIFQGTPLLMQLFLVYFGLALSFTQQMRYVILP